MNEASHTPGPSVAKCEPKPCPFCGGPGCHGAVFVSPTSYAYAGCTACRIFAKTAIAAEEPWEQLAVAKWNRRVADRELFASVRD